MAGHLIRGLLAAAPFAILIAAMFPELFRVRTIDAGGGKTRRALPDVVLLLLGALIALPVTIIAIHYFPAYLAAQKGNDYVAQLDTPRVVRTLTVYPEGVERTTVHPLQSLLLQPAGVAFLKAARVLGWAPSEEEGPLYASQLLAALSLCLSAGLLAAMLYRLHARLAPATLGVLLYVPSFSFLLHTIMPESGSLAAPTIILPYYLLAVFKDEPRSRREQIAFLVAGVLGMAITITNVVYAVVAQGCRSYLLGRRKWAWLGSVAWYALQVFALAALLSVCQMFLYPGGGSFLDVGKLGSEATFVSPENPWNPAHIGRVLAQMYGYAWSAPRLAVTGDLLAFGTLLPTFTLDSVSVFAVSHWNQLVLLLWGGVLLWACWRLQTDIVAIGMGVGLLATLALHVLYGNNYVMYSGNWMVALCALPALAAARMRRAFLPLLFLLPIAAGLTNTVTIRQLSSDIREQSRTLGRIQFAAGLPGAHELARVYVNSIGGISPGIGTTGPLFLLWDPASGRTSLAELLYGRGGRFDLVDGWIPAPIVRSGVGQFEMQQTTYVSPAGQTAVHLAIRSTGENSPSKCRLYCFIIGNRPMGASGVLPLGWNADSGTVSADGRPVLVCKSAPQTVAHGSECLTQSILESALHGRTDRPQPDGFRRVFQRVALALGRPDPYAGDEPSMLLSWSIQLTGDTPAELWFECPLQRPLTDSSADAPAKCLNSPRSESRPEVASTRPSQESSPEQNAAQAVAYWRERLKNVELEASSDAWGQAFKACASQIALNVQQDGRPVVAPVNYDVFIRDAAYMVHALLLSGQNDLARSAIDWMLAHPWAGRPHAEGDAPGQLLWVLGDYWRFTRDQEWLSGRLGQIRQLVAAIQAARTDTPGPLSVNLLGHVGALVPGRAFKTLQDAAHGRPPRLNYGTMDHSGELYVNFFGVAGLTAAADMLEAAGYPDESLAVRAAAQEYAVHLDRALALLGNRVDWDHRGQCAALWPCGYGLNNPKVNDFFLNTPRDWRKYRSPFPYLDLDEAHNYLLAGDRAAGWQSVELWLGYDTYRMWKTLDEGGPVSSVGYWKHLAVTPPWDSRIAIPHGWSLASLAALIRDCLVSEEAGAVHLLRGVPPEWFAPGQSLRFRLPSEYGELTFQLQGTATECAYTIASDRPPEHGFVIHLPEGFTYRELTIPAPPSGNKPEASTSASGDIPRARR
jgi:hypothetical protein